MKILHVIPSYKPAYLYGGPVMSVSKLCESLAREASVQIRLITTNANGKSTLDMPVGKAVDLDGLSVVYFRRNTGDPHEASIGLWRHLAKESHHYDIIHIHSWWNLCAVISVWICRRQKAKIVFSPRGMLSPYTFRSSNPGVKKWLHRAIGRRLLASTYYHATSLQENEECIQVIDTWKGFTIANMVELPDIGIRPVDNAVFTIGFLSRIDPKKGLEYIFYALQHRAFPVKLILAGNGDAAYTDSLRRLSRDLGIEDLIEWVGWLGPDEKFEALMGLDLLVLTSENENFANVVIESLYMGTAVCISHKVGLADFVQQTGMGWVTGLSVAEVESTLRQAYEDKPKRASIRLQGRDLINRHFSAPALVRQYLDMYQKVLSAEPHI